MSQYKLTYAQPPKPAKTVDEETGEETEAEQPEPRDPEFFDATGPCKIELSTPFGLQTFQLNPAGLLSVELVDDEPDTKAKNGKKTDDDAVADEDDKTKTKATAGKK